MRGTSRDALVIAARPSLGNVALEIPADPGQTIVAYSAAPGSPSAQALSLLASWAATTDTEGDARADRAEAADR